MKAVNIEDALHRVPFKPFELHVDNGRVIPVKHPDCVLLSASKATAVIADGEHMHIVNLDHVSSLSLEVER